MGAAEPRSAQILILRLSLLLLLLLPLRLLLLLILLLRRLLLLPLRLLRGRHPKAEEPQRAGSGRRQHP